MSTITLEEFESRYPDLPQTQTQTKPAPRKFGNMQLDWRELWEAPPEPMDFVLSGFLLGTVGALIAPGGAGKSFWALEAAVYLSTLCKHNLMGLHAEKGGRVVLLSLEDPQVVTKTRAYKITHSLTPELRDLISENLDIVDLFGCESDLMDDEFFSNAIEYCAGARLVIIDTLSRAHRLDENKNGEMSQLMSRMDSMAQKTGATVLFIHHISKSSNKEGAGNKATASRGASVLVDNARWVGFLQQMTKEDKSSVPENERWRYVKWGVSKINYGLPIPDSWLEKSDGGVLKLSVINEVNRGFNDEAGEGIDDFIAQMNANDFPKSQLGDDDEIDF